MMTASQAKLLIVEDDDRFRKTLESEFRLRGYQVISASSIDEVRSLDLSNLRFAAVDLRLGNDFGIQIVEHLRKLDSNIRIVVMTGYASIATAVEAVKRGANHYVAKPIGCDELERHLWTDTPLTFGEDGDTPIHSLARHEREYIEYVLSQCGQNISEAARRLGIHRQSLQRKLRKLPPLE
jgi:two-component system response regulator RegA